MAVSDSGLGIMSTRSRPSLLSGYPALSRLSDLELLVEIFREGRLPATVLSAGGAVSRGPPRKAVKFQAELDVRLPRVRRAPDPRSGGYRPNTALCYQDLPLVCQHTHICFSFGLDIPG